MADRPNILDGGLNIGYARGDFLIAGVGLFPTMQLFNPVASPVTLFCEQVWVGTTRLVYLASSLAVIVAPLIGNGISKRDFSAGVGEIYSGGIAVFVPVAVRIATKDPRTEPGVSLPMIDGAPIQIAPGTGLIAQVGNAGTLAAFNFVWTEQ